MKFDTLKLPAPFSGLLGEPFQPFYMMIYGRRFQGKSTVALCLANALAKVGKKVLFVSNEEGLQGSLQEKIKRLKVDQHIDFVQDFHEGQLKEYDVVFMDSVQTIGLKVEQFQAFKQQYQNCSIVMIFKQNRDGSSKGGSDWEHDVDAIMKVEDRSATMEKNRFPKAKPKTYKIF